MYYKDDENLKKQMNDFKNSILSIVVVIFSISFSLMGSDIIVSTKGFKVGAIITIRTVNVLRHEFRNFKTYDLMIS